jgi:RNA-directed DNA polymerase
MMLDIQSVGHLAKILETTPSCLIETADSAASFYNDLVLLDPAKPHKERDVVCVNGRLRKYQLRLYRKLLKPRLRPSLYSHGGVPGHSIKSNAGAHIDSVFVYSTDVANFYPSISHQRVYRIFAGEMGCSPDVARICTKLCTFRGHLALGLITSPIIADQLMLGVDHRIGKMCAKHALVYTRYVDDISISAAFPIESGGFMKIVVEILGRHGFRVNPIKHQDEDTHGRLSAGKCITKLVIKRGRLDVRAEYLEGVTKQLEDANRLAQGGECSGMYYTRDQIYGRIQFISWINPGRSSTLMRRFSAIDWECVEVEARVRGLIAVRKRLKKIPESHLEPSSS